MNKVTYKFVGYKDEQFKQVIDLRFKVLFEPYNKVKKYDYDEFDDISMHLLALDKEKVVGYSRMTNFNGKGKITNVVVSREYVGSGIGFEMLTRHIISAKENKFTYIYLNARVDTIDFYKKVGFKCNNEKFISEKSGLRLQPMYFDVK